MTPSKYDLSRTQWEMLIDEWIFSELDRRLLKRRLLDGVTYERLAEEAEMSEKQIRTRIHRAQARLFARV